MVSKNDERFDTKRQLPVTSGFSEIYQNIGSTRNKGVELTLNGDIIRNTEWRWNVGITFAKTRMKFWTSMEIKG